MNRTPENETHSAIGDAAHQGRAPLLLFPISIVIGSFAIGAPLCAIAWEGRYQLTTTVSDGGQLGWRLDRFTGKVAVCEVGKNPKFPPPPPPGKDPFEDLHLPPVDEIVSYSVNRVMIACGS